MGNRAETYKILKPMMYRQRVYKAGRVVRFNPKNAERFVASGQMLHVEAGNFVNVLTSGMRWPEEIVLLGSGPNGVPHYDKLEGKFVVALNGACDAPVKASVFGAQDPLLRNEKYFNDMAFRMEKSGRKFGLKEFNRGEFPMPIVERKSIAKYYPWFRLVFDVSRPLLDPAHINVDSPLIHAGGTVFGSFLQIAEKLMIKPEPPKKRRIIMCGIDMYGNMYWNKTKHRDIARKNKTWYRVKQVDALIKGMIDSGIEVVTVSETKLRNPTYVEGI